jgi:hypothetical protein
MRDWILICGLMHSACRSQRESRGLQRVAQSLGVQLQQQRVSRGLDEEQVLLVVEAVVEREHQLDRARQELQDAKASIQRCALCFHLVHKLLSWWPVPLINLPHAHWFPFS